MMLRQFFGPVTWHHQRRPIRPRLGLQNKKGPPGIGRGGLLRRSSQSSVYIEKREREREREREDLLEIIDPAQIIFFVLPLISLHAICPFCPRQAQGPMRTH
jgi:hypothetical protein